MLRWREAVEACADLVLGKSIVRCKDSPGFIANRLGIYWLQVGVVEAIDAGLTVEEADAVIGRPVGVPKTGVFGLIDLVGLDLMPHINGSLAKALPQSDAFHGANRDLPLIKKMIADGYTGRKGKGGFYRLNRTGGARSRRPSTSRPALSPGAEAGTAGVGGRGEESARAVLVEQQDRPLCLARLGRRSPTRRRSCRKPRTISPRSTRRCASATTGNGARSNSSINSASTGSRTNWRKTACRCRRCWARPRARPSIGSPTASGNISALDGAYHERTRPQGVLMLEDIKREMRSRCSRTPRPRSGISATACCASSSRARAIHSTIRSSACSARPSRSCSRNTRRS
jgi:hypothetical protein